MSVYRQLNEEKPRVLLLQMTLNTFFYENGNVFISRLYFYTDQISLGIM